MLPDSACSHGEVDVLLNNQEGTFQPAVGYGADVISEGIAAGDLNHDGNIDIVATNSNFGGMTSVFLGNGDGTLAPAVSYMVENGAISVAIADLDGDGNPDLATANFSSNSVSLLRGNGDRTFQSARGFGVGLGPASVLASDLNGDGEPDLVFSLHDASHVSVLLNSAHSSSVGQSSRTLNPEATLRPLQSWKRKPQVASASTSPLAQSNHAYPQPYEILSDGLLFAC